MVLYAYKKWLQIVQANAVLFFIQLKSVFKLIENSTEQWIENTVY